MALKHHAPWVPGPVDRALAHTLGPDVAWVPDGERILAVRCPRGPTDPASPVGELVRAVWALDPAWAHARLRVRLRTTALAPFDADLVAVAARRVSVVEPVPADVSAPPVTWLVPPPWPAADVPVDAEPRTAEGWAAWAVERLGAPATERATADRPVLAVLVDPDGRALGGAHNRAGADRSQHAERVLLAAWHGRIPAGATLVTTLQCCRMCAAAWATCAPPDLRVVYAEPDPGRAARFTLLARRGQERPAGGAR